MLDGPQPISRHYASRGLTLHYADWGNADAPLLILVHGSRDHCRSWDYVARELQAQWHVVAPDLRGHGDSAWSPDGDYSSLAYFTDLVALIAHLGRMPVTLVGHSMGGTIAVCYAGVYPENVRRLVTIEGLGPTPHLAAERDAVPFHQRLDTWLFRQLRNDTGSARRFSAVDIAVERMMATNKHLTRPWAEYLTRHGLKQLGDGSYVWKFDRNVHNRPPVDMTGEQLHALWRRITCPMLLVYGTESWTTSPADDGRLAYLSDARVSLYPEAGHWIHHDQRERFVEELRQFLLP
jgi:pimeloyl-ACP methyl ester carboxylesterase